VALLSHPSSKYQAVMKIKPPFRFLAPLVVIYALTAALNAQPIIFAENMGVPTGTTAIAAYATGTAPATFENAATLTYDQGDATAAADVRSSNPSSGYVGASGGGNIFFTSSAGERGFAIGGIAAANYNSLQLTYGYRKENGSALPTFSVDYWNGSGWVTIANTAGDLFNEAANAAVGWYLAKTLNLPIGAQIDGLKIRFVKSGSVSLRIDDIKLTGTEAGSAFVSSYSPSTAPIGATVLINGGGFEGATAVSFNGTNAIFSVLSATQISATVPVGATTGPVTVTKGGIGFVGPTFTVGATPPSLGVSPLTLTGFNSIQGAVSAAQTFAVTAANLVGEVLVTAPANFEISSNGATFASSLPLAPVGGAVNATVSVRIASTAPLGAASGNVTVDTTDVATVNVAVSGNVNDPGTPGLVYWNFNTTTPTSGVLENWQVGEILRGNNNGTTTLLTSGSPSSGYSNPFGVPASGGNNAGAASRTGALNTEVDGSAYFEVNIVPPATNTVIGLTNISFGSRATSTGPQAFAIRSSADGFASDLYVGTLANNSTWAMQVAAPVAIALSNGTNTFRIYGYNGAGSAASGSANWRIDDLTFALGEVNPTAPAINLNPGNISGLLTFNGTPSTASSYTLSGVNLGANNLVVTPSSPDVQVSTNSATGFTNQLTFVPAGGVVSGTTVYVRIADTAPIGPVSASVSHVSGTTTNTLPVTGTVYDSSRGGSTNTLVGWDAFLETGFGPSPWAPVLANSNVVVATGLTRGAGVGTGGSAAGRAWGGTTWNSASAPEAAVAEQFASFTVTPAAGFNMAVTGIGKFDYRRPSSGPTSGVLQVQVGSGGFDDVAVLDYSSTASSGASLGPIDLTTYLPLQNVAAGTPVTFRIVNYAASQASGTWYIYDVGNNPDIDFELVGSVTPSSAPTYDAWADSFGLDPTVTTGPTAGAPTADPDSDGFNNQQEYSFGTNPTQGTSSLLSTEASGGNLIIRWLERAGVTYTPQSTSNLATTAFATDVTVTVVAGPTDPAPPTGYTRKQFTVPATGNRFYRVTATSN
jgi:hypothetical protein